MSNLTNKIIISTRPLNEDDSIRDYLIKNGATVLDFPMIKIFPVTLTEETKKYLYNIKEYQWLVFTSRNGAKFFFQFMKELGISTNELKGLKIAVIGKNTASEVIKQYQQPDLVSTGNNSLDLANELAEKLVSTDKVLLALAELANDNLEKKICNIALVDRFDVYKTENEELVSPQIIEKIKENDYHIILFTSPSGFRHFQQLKNENSITAKIRAACIGSTTEKEMLTNNCKPLFVSSRSEGESFAKQIENYLINSK